MCEAGFITQVKDAPRLRLMLEFLQLNDKNLIESLFNPCRNVRGRVQKQAALLLPPWPHRESWGDLKV